MTFKEHDEIVSGLPALSRTVYNWLNEVGLYAEPEFSDVTVPDIAEAVGITVNQVKGVLSHLHTLGLTETEEWEANFEKNEFIHTILHSKQLTS